MDAAKTNYKPVQAAPKPISRAAQTKPHQKGRSKRALEEPGSAQPSKRTKTGNTATADLGQDEVQANEVPEDVPAFKQPALITGATLKDYQLEGVAWMAGLYNNGISGILGAFITSSEGAVWTNWKASR